MSVSAHRPCAWNLGDLVRLQSPRTRRRADDTITRRAPLRGPSPNATTPHVCSQRMPYSDSERGHQCTNPPPRFRCGARPTAYVGMLRSPWLSSSLRIETSTLLFRCLRPCNPARIADKLSTTVWPKARSSCLAPPKGAIVWLSAL